MALSPKEMHTRIIENLKQKTGKDFSAWSELSAKIRGDKSDKDLVSDLKSDYGLGHYTAVAIVKEMTTGNAYTDEKMLIEKLFGACPQARASFDTLSTWLLQKTGVSQTPCKTYVGFRASRQFVIARPTKRDTLEIGLALPEEAVNGLSRAANFGGARITSKLEVKSQQISTKTRLLIEQSLEASR